jgi:hypothetical protein
MRTRIEIDDEQREKLLALAAARGERSCGRLVQEAVALYLEQRERPAVALQLEPKPAPAPIEPMRAETRAERLRLVIGWLREEAEELVVLGRAYRGRLRRSAAHA